MTALSSFLLLRRTSSSALHLQNRLLSAWFLPFSTSSDNDIVTQIESIVEKSVPKRNRFEFEPHFPFPDGFPFSIDDSSYGIILQREDKDEKTDIWISNFSNKLKNGNPSLDMKINILRGYWSMQLDMIYGYKTMSIQEVRIRESRNQHVRCLEEFLDSKGIEDRKIVSLYDLFRKKNNESANKISKFSEPPFDSIEENPENGNLTLRRKTEYEIIEIQVNERIWDRDSGLTLPSLDIKFRYGDNFTKCMDFDVVVFPDDQGKIFIRNVTMSVDDPKGDGQVHMDELVGFLERRGINSSNLDFMVKYVEKRMEYVKSIKSICESV